MSLDMLTKPLKGATDSEYANQRRFLSWIISCGLACIPLGSTVAFLNIQTIGNSGLLTSYIICISCRLYHRNLVSSYGRLSEPPPFFLGRIGGNLINSVALLFLFCFLVSDLFPPMPHPDATTMNWSCVALGGTTLLALFCYIWLRKSYLGAGAGNDFVEMVDVGSDEIQDPDVKGFNKAA